MGTIPPPLVGNTDLLPRGPQQHVIARSWLLNAAFAALLSFMHIAAAAPTSCAAATPILVGDVSSLSGRLQFPESQQAAKLAFDAVNANCGIKGRRIQY